MKLVKPLVASSNEKEQNSFIDPKSLSKEDKELVSVIDKGHEAEAQLTEKLHDAVKESDDFNATEIEINPDKGSYLRVVTVEGVAMDDGKVTGDAIVTESVNGHMTELMSKLNTELEVMLEEANTDTTEA